MVFSVWPAVLPNIFYYHSHFNKITENILVFLYSCYFGVAFGGAFP